ncbi:MAG: hypothetical protein GX647_11880 [Clostridiales bacterium]|jgi:hypothetical protein|nr:hypothetical protein [Clostridiales bacterium]OPZ69039.1 MAG: hypothetical protein BWY81_00600 [Firmicutes bacterium ADurb.Bin467]
MKKVVFFAALLLILALAAPATAATWLELSKAGAQCIGASADGARFLMVDEAGMLKEEGECALLPLGISSDGLRALCIELKSASLLWIDLNTLEVKTVPTDEDFGALYAEKNAEYRPVMTLSMLGWNGGDVLAGPTAPAGCALTLG